jgi:hypothetical protein
MRQHLSEKCDGGGVSRSRADRIVTDAILERVRFRLDDAAEFISARQAWEGASMHDRRRLLGDVLDRVVIEARTPDEKRGAIRRLRVEWKPEFASAGLVALPLGGDPPPKRRNVSEGRVESQRARRAARAKSVRSKRTADYYSDWAERRQRLIDAR